MPFALTMPKLSPTMTEGTIVKWLKKPGDFVESGDAVMEVATDKATVEHGALDEGFLRKILIEEGDEAYVNQAIAVFTETADESIDDFQVPRLGPEPVIEEVAVESKEAAPAQATATMSAMAQPAFVPEAPLDGYVFEAPIEEEQKRLFASPLVKKLAKEKGLDLSTVKGSGPRGRVVSRDLDMAQPKGKVSFGARQLPEAAPGSFEEEKMSPMRKAIGTRLQQAKSFIPHYYVSVDVDVESMIDIRNQLKEAGLKITFNDFIVRAAAVALKEHPEINSGFNSQNGTIIRFKTVDVAIAVTIDGGLITPIVRHADHKNLGEISAEVRKLAGLAKEGKLQEHQYKGGSFTISNLGMFGVSDFIAVINPPQAAIMAIGGMLDVPVVKDGTIVPGKRMRLTLSSDHRVIDGAQAAQFLNTVKHNLEHPAMLVV